jgi:serine/threonine protein kinase
MSKDNARTRYCAFCLNTFLGSPKECPNKDCHETSPEGNWGKLFEPGERIDNRFRIDRRIIIGGAGVTYLCQETDEEEQALGPILLLQILSHRGSAPPYLNKLKSQLSALTTLSHPSIIRVNEFIDTDEYRCVVTCYEGGGNLIEQLREAGAMSVTHLAQLGLQMCSALRAAHGAGIVHGNIKPENVLLDYIPEQGEPPLIRVSDFGVLSTQDAVLHEDGATVPVSSLYAAPERILGGEATEKSDVFSLGALLLFCLNLRPIISGAEKMQPVELVKKLAAALPPRWQPPKGQSVDRSQLAFLNAVLAATMLEEPDKRCTLDEVQHYLEALLEVDDSDSEDVFETPDWAQNDSAPEPPPQVEFQPFEATEGDSVEAPQATVDAEEEELVEVVQEDVEAWWFRYRKLISYLWGGVSMISMVGFCFVWYLHEEVLSPARMEARGPAPYELVSGDPVRQPDYQAISTSLQEQVPELGECDLEVDRITVWIIVEPDGSVRAADTSYLPLTDVWCVRRKLLGFTLDRRTEGVPYRFRMNISL